MAEPGAFGRAWPGWKVLLQNVVLVSAGLALICGALMPGNPACAEDDDKPRHKGSDRMDSRRGAYFVRPAKVRKDKWIAYRMAKSSWLSVAAKGDPEIVAAICEHSGPARLLAGHRHLGEIAEADPYLCRRLTKWRGATYELLKNQEIDKVIRKDPEGIYRAIRRDPRVARYLARNVMFNQMIVDTPELGSVIASHL
jgi:hypothetical protein